MAVELVVCSNHAIVNEIEEKTYRKLLRLLLADIKESLLVEVIAALESFDITTKRLSCDSQPTLHHLLNFARRFVAHECFGTLDRFQQHFMTTGDGDRDGDML